MHVTVCREVITFGYRETTSAQWPESAHIPNLKAIARQTNNKQDFLTILRFHAKSGILQSMREGLFELHARGQLQADAGGGGGMDEGHSDSSGDEAAEAAERHSSRNENIACELGWRYPHFNALMTRNGLDKDYYTPGRVMGGAPSAILRRSPVPLGKIGPRGKRSTLLDLAGLLQYVQAHRSVTRLPTPSWSHGTFNCFVNPRRRAIRLAISLVISLAIYTST